MAEVFNTIIDFIRCRGRCFFCSSQLKCRLTNFVGIKEDNLPLLNAPLIDNKFSFNLSYTSSTSTVEAFGILDINTNVLSFTDKNRHIQNPGWIILRTLKDLRPYIQLYCSKRKCPHLYTVASDILYFNEKMENGYDYDITKYVLYYESFVKGDWQIWNDHINCEANIYLRNNPNMKPISMPWVDLTTVEPVKLLNRIQTIVNFS